RGVAGGYRLLSGHRIRFDLGSYDASRPLVIDPILAYGTFYGQGAASYGVAVDATGSAYMTGDVDGSIPASNAYQHFSGGGSDAFAAKLNPAGTEFIYSTYVGGKGSDGAQAIAVDGSGNAYITGYTFSKDFPKLSLTLDTSFPGTVAYAVRLNP